MYKMNIDLEVNVQKHNKLNGCIKRYFGNNMREEHGSETWRNEGRRSGSRRPLLRTSLRDTERSKTTITNGMNGGRHRSISKEMVKSYRRGAF
jgi:hypothetical protein